MIVSRGTLGRLFRFPGSHCRQPNSYASIANHRGKTARPLLVKIFKFWGHTIGDIVMPPRFLQEYSLSLLASFPLLGRGRRGWSDGWGGQRLV